jgi:hypothetical protein
MKVTNLILEELSKNEEITLIVLSETQKNLFESELREIDCYKDVKDFKLTESWNPFYFGKRAVKFKLDKSKRISKIKCMKETTSYESVQVKTVVNEYRLKTITKCIKIQ